MMNVHQNLMALITRTRKLSREKKNISTSILRVVLRSVRVMIMTGEDSLN